MLKLRTLHMAVRTIHIVSAWVLKPCSSSSQHLQNCCLATKTLGVDRYIKLAACRKCEAVSQRKSLRSLQQLQTWCPWPSLRDTNTFSNTPYCLPSGKCATPVVSFGIQHKQIFARLNCIAGYVASLNNCKIAKSSRLEIAVLSKPICL